MTKEEAKEFAKTMTFRQAVYNAMNGKCVPFRKATAVKLKELLSLADSLDKMRAEIEDSRDCYIPHETEYDAYTYDAYNKCLKIFDKYKAESEEER